MKKDFKLIPPHAHCERCNRILPDYQSICLTCLKKVLDEEINRKPYYESSVEEINDKFIPN